MVNVAVQTRRMVRHAVCAPTLYVQTCIMLCMRIAVHVSCYACIVHHAGCSTCSVRCPQYGARGVLFVVVMCHVLVVLLIALACIAGGSTVLPFGRVVQIQGQGVEP
jgi:hypothetical protein